jgi:Fanconi anemia group M protein
VCDYREREVADHLKLVGAVVNKTNLDLADFVCSERVAIERKTHSDFVASVVDGRLFDQVRALKEEYEKPIIIIEGYSNARIAPNALKAAIASLLVNFGIPLVATKNPADTAHTIYWIAHKEQFGNFNGREDKSGQGGQYLAIKVGKKPKDIMRLQEEVVAGLPGVSTVLSKRLLEHFGQVEKIFAASEDELQKVKGIGKKLAKRIRDVLTKNY